MSFDSLDLRALCEDENMALQQLGIEISSKLKDRIADINAARVVSELLAGDPKPLKNDPGCYKINIGNSHQLIFCCNHVKAPLNNKKGINWQEVSRIKLLEIRAAA